MENTLLYILIIGVLAVTGFGVYLILQLQNKLKEQDNDKDKLDIERAVRDEISKSKDHTKESIDKIQQRLTIIDAAQKKPHPFVVKNNLKFIPFEHEKMDHWRNALTGGISFLDKNTNIEIHGGVDDIWFDQDKEELVVVDYKAQSSNAKVETEPYLSNIYHHGYKMQMDIYVHILRKMDFKVSDIAYFYVCNGEKSYDKFDEKLNFTTTLVPYKTDTSWVDKQIIEMKKTLDSEKVPEIT